MNRKAPAVVRRLTISICFVSLVLAPPTVGGDTVAGNGGGGSMRRDGGAVISPPTPPRPGLASPADASWTCLPRYGEPDEFLHLYPHGGLEGVSGWESATTLWGVDSADFDGDGWPDAVLWRGLQPTGVALELDVLLNDGQGTLALGTSEVFSGTVPSVVEGRELVLADFNGDGRSDMFFADHGMDTDPFPGHQNTLVLSAPGGKMVDATGGVPQQSDQTHSATAADIDGDDDIDLYVGNLFGGGVPPQIWLNDGTGVFTVAVGLLPPEQVTDPPNWYTTSEFADVNTDTFPDLILDQGNPNRPSHVLLNDGTGHFSQMETPLPPTIFAPNQQPLDIKAADINGDGYLDPFLSDTRSTYVGRYIQILINNGDGTFRDETAARLPQADNDDTWIVWVDLIDLDMDGRLDIVARPMAGREPLFYLNKGDGTFDPLPNVFNIDINNLFTFLDVDQDGFLDVLWSYPGCYDGTCPEVHFLVRALGCPVFLPLVGRSYPLEPCVPEFGQDELLLTIDADRMIERLRTGDLNGDGWADAIVARVTFQTTRTHEISILLNDQQGGLVDGTQTVFDGPIPEMMQPIQPLLRDFNGDGRTDVFLADRGMDTHPFPGYQNTLVLSSPGGKLVDATANLPQVNDAPDSATAADIDGDNDTDLYIGNLCDNDDPPQIWLNDGMGRFSVADGLLPPEQTDCMLNWYTASQFADVNNDTFPDLILGHGDPGRDSHILLNDGSGRFSKVETDLPPTLLGPNDVALDIKAADISGDGYPDLFVNHSRNTDVGRYIQVLINNGDGSFRDETAARLPQDTDEGWLRYLDLLDLNYDGHVDIVGTAMVGPNVFYLNNGQGVFGAWDPGVDLYDFAFLDIDRDGWRDILLSGSADPAAGLREWHAIIRHTGCLGP